MCVGRDRQGPARLKTIPNLQRGARQKETSTISTRPRPVCDASLDASTASCARVFSHIKLLVVHLLGTGLPSFTTPRPACRPPSLPPVPSDKARLAAAEGEAPESQVCASSQVHARLVAFDGLQVEVSHGLGNETLDGAVAEEQLGEYEQQIDRGGRHLDRQIEPPDARLTDNEVNVDDNCKAQHSCASRT